MNFYQEYAISYLEKLGINKEKGQALIARYDEPHRFYHTWRHIETMLKQGIKEDIIDDSLFLAIIFHDIIYNPKSDKNEEKSANLLHAYIKDKDAMQAILDTKTHKPSNKTSELLCKLDLEILNGDFESFVEFEKNIFKEFQFAPLDRYIAGRVEALKGLGVDEERINYVKHLDYRIGVYAGSFNPFHKGHYNVLQKAEELFDKVIIAIGNNTKKDRRLPTSDYPIKPIFYHQQDIYDGLLSEYIFELEEAYGRSVTLIRGLRNSSDLEYEKTQLEYLRDFKPDIKVVSFFCDKEYEHISSTAIRQLRKLKEHEKSDSYLPKL